MTSGAYCAVQGCKNQKTMKEISFFKLPMDAKRREDWLYMIGRPDLLQKPDLKPECHFVCHVHFEEFMMIRKPLLRQNAIPTKNIPILPILNEVVRNPTTKEDKSTQTRKKFYKELVNCKRTSDISEGEMMTEMLGEFDSKNVKKRKLNNELSESDEKVKRLEAEVEELKKQLEAAKAANTSVGSSNSQLASTVGKTADSETDIVTNDIVVKIEIKRENFDEC